jgi:hypothetical protein
VSCKALGNNTNPMRVVKLTCGARAKFPCQAECAHDALA